MSKSGALLRQGNWPARNKCGAGKFLASAASAIPTNRSVWLRLLVVLLFVDSPAQAIQLLIDFFTLGVGQSAAIGIAVRGNFMPQFHFTRLQSRSFA
jgi:hypothetical protein